MYFDFSGHIKPLTTQSPVIKTLSSLNAFENNVEEKKSNGRQNFSFSHKIFESAEFCLQMLLILNNLKFVPFCGELNAHWQSTA